jgi:hypothetical protein
VIQLTVKFAGESFEVRPAFAVIEKIEQRFTLLDFLRSVNNQKYSNVAWVLFCTFAGNGIKKTYEECGEYVIANLLDATLAATEIVSAAIGVGPEKESKKKVTEQN